MSGETRRDLAERVQDAVDDWSDEHTTAVCEHEAASSRGNLMNECWRCRIEQTIRVVAEEFIAEIRSDARTDIEWQREHKQTHEDVVRIVGTEDGYNAAIRCIETAAGL